MQEKLFLNNGTDTLPIISCYNYTYNFGEGKEVLRITFKMSDTSFDVARNFLTNREIFILSEEKEDGTLVKTGEFTHFTLDLIGTYNSNDDTINFEITRLGETTRTTLDNTNQITELELSMAMLYEGLLGGTV